MVAWIQLEQFIELIYLFFYHQGNGYLGISLNSQSQIQIISDTRSNFITTGFSPIVHIASDTWEDANGVVIQMNQGAVRRVQCFKLSQERSAFASHLLYVHRIRPSIIVQEIELINPSEHMLDLEFRTTKDHTRNDLKLIEEKDFPLDFSKDTYLLKILQISMRQHNSIICVILSPKIPENTRIKPDR